LCSHHSQGKANAQVDAVKFEVTTLKEAIVELQHQLATHRDNAKQSLTDHEKTTKSEVCCYLFSFRVNDVSKCIGFSNYSVCHEKLARTLTSMRFV
jgi:hypothetical protein